MNNKKLPRKTSDTVSHFLQQVAATPNIKAATQRGRLLFALDATASRQPTWNSACEIQSSMFKAAAALGGLEIQLCYYRGFNEFNVAPWTERSSDLVRQMRQVHCLGGYTQIGRLLAHVKQQAVAGKVNAVIFVGDSVEESPDQLCQLAGELALLNVPLFLFQEGDDHLATQTFRQMAQLSRGAWCHFDANSAKQLRDLLAAVAIYASGGAHALLEHGHQQGGAVLQLAQQIKQTA